MIRARAGRGRVRHVTGEMNKLEGRFFNEMIWPKLVTNEILHYSFESIRFVLGPNCAWCPDFVVQLSSGVLEVWEVKGFWEDDARVKFKTAATLFPYLTIRAFVPIAKAKGGGWDVETLNAPEAP